MFRRTGANNRLRDDADDARHARPTVRIEDESGDVNLASVKKATEKQPTTGNANSSPSISTSAATVAGFGLRRGPRRRPLGIIGSLPKRSIPPGRELLRERPQCA
uniref:Uncharacterized protein n=1 Tax=Plectus sambesii TaxID=2011161 RepID=A0A914WAY7_9BILA